MIKKLRNILSKLPGTSHYSLWGVLCNPWDALVMDQCRALKWFYQRGRRGYADCDTWDLGCYLDSWMPAAIRELKNDTNGCPGALFPNHDLFFEETTKEQSEKAHETWINMLEAMAAGFEASHRLSNEFITWENPLYKELEQKRQKGMALFAEWHQSLWD